MHPSSTASPGLVDGVHSPEMIVRHFRNTLVYIQCTSQSTRRSMLDGRASTSDTRRLGDRSCGLTLAPVCPRSLSPESSTRIPGERQRAGRGGIRAETRGGVGQRGHCRSGPQDGSPTVKFPHRSFVFLPDWSASSPFPRIADSDPGLFSGPVSPIRALACLIAARPSAQPPPPPPSCSVQSASGRAGRLLSILYP